jgi:hypothetical protein
MAVMIDDEPLAVDSLGLSTVGEVLAHVQRQDRLVTTMLIDGEEPDLDALAALRARPVTGHTLYIETCPPTEIACEILAGTASQLESTDPLRIAAVEALRQNQPARAMEKLGGCLAAWQAAQQAVTQIAQLLKLDLELVRVDGESLHSIAENFVSQLREVRTCLENRDYVLLADILEYEASAATRRWIDATRQLQQAAGCPLT